VVDRHVTSHESNDAQVSHDFYSTGDTTMLVGCTNDRFNRSTLGGTSDKEIDGAEIDKRCGHLLRFFEALVENDVKTAPDTIHQRTPRGEQRHRVFTILAVVLTEQDSNKLSILIPNPST
jgi:hypothetical protein